MANGYPESVDDRNRRLLRERFEALSRPLIEFLNGNFNPHTSIRITTTGAELSEGRIGFTTNEYVPD